MDGIPLHSYATIAKNLLNNNIAYSEEDDDSFVTIAIGSLLSGDPQTDGIRTPKGVVQSYDSIKQQCLASGHLFEDPIFSPRSSKRSDCQWLRPFEMSSSPKFISSGISRFDVVQGELGDCWLVAAVANLTLNNKLFSLVVPGDQTFDRDSYCGLFRFRFYQFGKWVEVIVDDKLPCRDGKLLFMHSTDPDEFWSPLLEKAYAKLHGSYDALRGGTTCEAMVDLTAGLTEFFDIQTNEAPVDLNTIIKKGFERGSLMGCSIEALDESQRENELPNGLIKGHAYSITSVMDLEVGGRTLPMLRLRNPWSGTSEWNGPWSDKSREWAMISDYEKQKIGLTFDADGEFWIAFHDFKTNFTRVELCNLTPDELNSNVQKKWHQKVFEGSWLRGSTAGGCRNNLQSFAMNPQYIITLIDHDEEDDEDLCTVIVALMQKNKRSATKYQMGSSELTIGFAIYAVNQGIYQADPVGASSPHYRQQLLTTDFFKYNCSVARCPTYINLREVTSRFKLPPGTYAIIPSTFDKGEEGEFILRVWTESPVKDAPPGIYPSPADIRPVTPQPVPSPPSPKPYEPLPKPTPAYPRYPTPTPPQPAEPTKRPDYPAYPSYPPYPMPQPGQPTVPGYPAYPPLPNAGGGEDGVRYPTLPDEPSIIRRKVPPPPPGPSIDISIGEVIGTLSTIVSILMMCWNTYQRMTSTSQTYPSSWPAQTPTSYPYSGYGGLQRASQPTYGQPQPPGYVAGGGAGQTYHNTTQETVMDGMRRIITTTTNYRMSSSSGGGDITRQTTHKNSRL